MTAGLHGSGGRTSRSHTRAAVLGNPIPDARSARPKAGMNDSNTSAADSATAPVGGSPARKPAAAGSLPSLLHGWESGWRI